jgi:hypothetical protein
VLPNIYFCQNEDKLGEKVAQKCGLLLYLKTATKENNRPIVENLPNLVALLKSWVARWFVFKPKLANSGKFWRVLRWKMLVY